MKRLWDLRQSANPGTLELYIYGDVESDGEDWWTGQTIRSETSAGHFRDELAKYPDAHDIHVYINSHGGSVFEGTAIYNQLRRHPAQVTVHIDGFACSIASVIAMAGGRAIMPRNAMMMIHNAYLYAVGNSAELRKAADDLDAINRGNWQAYLQKSGGKLSEEELCRMLDAETWLTAEDCIRLGLADEYADKDVDISEASTVLQRARLNVDQRISLQKALAAQLRAMTSPHWSIQEGPQPPEESDHETSPSGIMQMIGGMFKNRK